MVPLYNVTTELEVNIMMESNNLKKVSRLNKINIKKGDTY